MTVGTPLAKRICAAVSAPAVPVTFTPVRYSASRSFGVRMETFFRRSSGRRQAGAGLRMRRRLEAVAQDASSMTVGRGISSCARMTSAVSTAVRAFSSSETVRVALAPGATTIQF